MKKRPYFWGISIAALLFSGAVVLSLTCSLWFFRALVGGNSGTQTVGYQRSFLDANAVLKQVKGEFTSLAPELTDGYARFVYTTDSDAQYIIGIPRLTFQLSLPRTLREQSWDVRRIGYIIYARRANSDTSLPALDYQLGNAISETLKGVFVDRLPARARVIFQTRDASGESMAMYIEEKGGVLYASMHTNSSAFEKGHGERMYKNIPPSETSYVSLQSDVLPYLPNIFLGDIENKISESLRFIKTRPQVLTSLLQLSPAVLLAYSNDALAIGVSSSDDKAAKLIHTWIHAEQGTRHPQKKAFSLPDKTLGYEYIPGVSNAYFSLNKAKNNCLPSEQYDESIFLCGKDTSLVLSNQEALGSNLVSALADTKMFQGGVIQGSVLEAVGLSAQFEKIEYVVSDNNVEIWMDRILKK